MMIVIVVVLLLSWHLLGVVNGNQTTHLMTGKSKRLAAANMSKLMS